MRYLQYQPILNQLASATATSPAIPLSQIFKMSAVIVVATGTISGSLQLQVTNDPQPRGSLTWDDSATVNWSNLGTATALSAAGLTLIAPQDMCYSAMRVVYTAVSGTAHVTVNLVAQGI